MTGVELEVMKTKERLIKPHRYEETVGRGALQYLGRERGFVFVRDLLL